MCEILDKHVQPLILTRIVAACLYILSVDTICHNFRTYCSI